MLKHALGIWIPLLLAAAPAAQGSVWSKRSGPPLPTGFLQLPRVSLAFDGGRSDILAVIRADSKLSTYEWNGAVWTSRGSQLFSSMREFSFVYDSVRGVHVGISQDGGSITTYEWSDAASAWQARAVNFPSLREGSGLAYDPNRARVVLFGGRGTGNVQPADTYEFDGTSWQLRGTGGPVPRMNMAMTYDPNRRTVLLFGGESPNGSAYYGDTWEWNGLYWREAFGVAGASARRTAGIAYDQVLAKAVLIGGFGYSGTVGTGTWEWDGTAWSGDATSVQPTGHEWPAMAFDPIRNRLVFAGIRWNGTAYESECWERFSLPNSQPRCTPFGVGCAGNAGIPGLAPAAGQLPRIGKTFTVQLSNVPAGPLRFPFGFVGASKTLWSSVPLPFDLGTIGMPGCTLYCGTDLVFQLANLSGIATWTLTLPPDVALVGAQAYQQGLVLDPGVNLLGVTTSNALELKLGI